MRWSIRTKLIAFIVLPIVLIACVVGGATWLRLQARLENQAQADAARQANHYADLLDGRLRTVAQVATSTAAYLETHPELTEAQLYETLRRNVEQNPLIYGGAIAFQPHSYDPQRKLFSPYVCRDGQGGLRQLDIAGAYDYDDPAVEWWWKPRELQQPLWTAPYLDEGVGEILMSTYSVPFHRQGEFSGIATIDIPLASLEDAVGLDELPHGNFAIVDREGRFVTHPDPKRILHDGLHRMAKRFDRPELSALADRMAAGEAGVATLPDWAERDDKVWLYYAPIRSTGWSFAAIITEGEALSLVRSYAKLAAGGLLLALVLIVIAVVLVSKSLTDPVKRLQGMVRTVAAGNLDAKPMEVRGQDEIADLGRSFNQMLADLRLHVQHLAEEQAARKAVEGELEAARKIQSALLPQTFPPYPDRDDLDLHATLIPAKAVAGDFYDFFLLDENTLGFVVADVSGKGVPAALFMAVARTLLRNLATVTRDPGEILKRCGQMLNQDNAGTMFVTCFLGVYDFRTGVLSHANAGHPPPYRIDAQGNVTVFGEPTGTLMGIFPDADYGTLQTQLDPGDRLVLFTDGVTEAESPDGSMLEEEGLVRLLQEKLDGDATALCDHICQRVTEFQQGEQSDDVTVLVFGRPV